MLHSPCIILVYLLVLLPLNSIWGQQTAEQQLMQLVRIYEQAQDSAFMPDPTPKRVETLLRCTTRSAQVKQKLQSSVDTNIIQVANYLNTAIQLYTITTQYQISKQDTLLQRQLKALRPAVDVFTPENFPMRFTIMSTPVIMRFENIAPDLYLYYEILAPLCSCRELSRLVQHVRLLQSETLADQCVKSYRKKCHKY